MSKLVDLKGLQRFFDNIKKLFASKETEDAVKKLEAFVPTIKPITTEVGGEPAVFEIDNKETLQEHVAFLFAPYMDGNYYVFRHSPVLIEEAMLPFENTLQRAGIDEYSFCCYYYNYIEFDSEDTSDRVTIIVLAEVTKDGHRYLVFVEI